MSKPYRTSTLGNLHAPAPSQVVDEPPQQTPPGGAQKEPQSVSQSAPQSVPPAKRPATRGRRPSSGPKAVSVPDGFTRVAVYMHRPVFEDAKSAYVLSQRHRGTPQWSRTFAEWVGRQLETHNARTPEQRAEIAERLGDDDRTDGTANNKVFLLATEILTDTQRALDADLAAGRAISRSAYAVEAIRDAIAREQEANGGVLPPAPKRLPNGF